MLMPLLPACCHHWHICPLFWLSSSSLRSSIALHIHVCHGFWSTGKSFHLPFMSLLWCPIVTPLLTWYMAQLLESLASQCAWQVRMFKYIIYYIFGDVFLCAVSKQLSQGSNTVLRRPISYSQWPCWEPVRVGANQCPPVSSVAAAALTLLPTCFIFGAFLSADVSCVTCHAKLLSVALAVLILVYNTASVVVYAFFSGITPGRARFLKRDRFKCSGW